MQIANLEKLRDIFCVVFDLEKDEDFDVIKQEGFKKWDSLSHVSLIVAVESEFNIQVNTSDYENFISFLSIQLILEELGF